MPGKPCWKELCSRLAQGFWCFPDCHPSPPQLFIILSSLTLHLIDSSNLWEKTDSRVSQDVIRETAELEFLDDILQILCVQHLYCPITSLSHKLKVEVTLSLHCGLTSAPTSWWVEEGTLPLLRLHEKDTALLSCHVRRPAARRSACWRDCKGHPTASIVQSPQLEASPHLWVRKPFLGHRLAATSWETPRPNHLIEYFPNTQPSGTMRDNIFVVLIHFLKK